MEEVAVRRVCRYQSMEGHGRTIVGHFLVGSWDHSLYQTDKTFPLVPHDGITHQHDPLPSHFT